MLKNILSILMLSAGTFLWSQTYYLAEPEGYGAGTTGGKGGEIVIAEDYESLKKALKSEEPKIILVKGEISFSEKGRIREVVKDKSIIGLPGAKLSNAVQNEKGSGILSLRDGSHNVVIRNLIFEGPGAYDINGEDNMTVEGAKKVWIDHCEFQDGQDGNLDFRGNSDDITVSWTKFTYLKNPKGKGSGGSDDHRFSNLVGANGKDAPEDGHFSITFNACYWGDGTKERMPRARNAQLHILNSYYRTSVPKSRAIGLGGGSNNTFVLVENTDFMKVDRVLSTYSSDGGTAFIEFKNTINGAENIGKVPQPPYKSTLVPVNTVRRLLTDKDCGAGATLSVNEEGIVTPNSCANKKLQ